MLAIIGGSNMRNTLKLEDVEEIEVETEYGAVKMLKAKNFVFCQRHGLKPEDFKPPHAINHRANLKAIASFQPDAVVAFTSVGSLKKSLPPGTLLIPDDYFSPFCPITYFDSLNPLAITPGFDEDLRKKIMSLLDKNNIEYVEKGCYAQMPGPRFETRSEVRFLSDYADIVGMTAGSEATLAKELELAYAVIAMIDNYANGIADKPLTFEQFEAGVKESFKTVKRVFDLVIENL